MMTMLDLDLLLASMLLMTIDLWDSLRKEWRAFTVVPPEPRYQARCGNGLHQFAPGASYCACGAVAR